MKRTLFCAVGLFLAATGTGWTGDENINDMLLELTKGLTQTNTVTLAEASALKALLPTTETGFRRIGATAGTEKVLAANVSKARGVYEGPGGARLSIEISDWATQARIAWGRMGLAAQRRGEGDWGYDRDAKIQGWPAVERLDRTRQAGQIFLRIEDRFILSIVGERVTEEQLKQALNAVDLKRLAALGKP